MSTQRASSGRQQWSCLGGNPTIPGTDAALNNAVARGAVKVVKNAETGIDMYYVPKASVGQR